MEKLEKLENLENLIEEIFGDFADFCEKCCADGKCNGSCCYEQIKEMFEELNQMKKGLKVVSLFDGIS